VSTERKQAANHSTSEAAHDSAYDFGHERWQGPTFAASWISPPSPRRYGEDHVHADPAAPHLETDHA
jgi:hypothetical protein